MNLLTIFSLVLVAQAAAFGAGWYLGRRNQLADIEKATATLEESTAKLRDAEMRDSFGNLPLGTDNSKFSDCRCKRCADIRNSLLVHSNMFPHFRGMTTCNICGNKRCPHGQDHRFKCTQSNSSGQVGVLIDTHPDSGK